jgi:hypothetical protein
MKKSPVDDENLGEIEEAFTLMNRNPEAETAYKQARNNDEAWKARDPEGYKKDMEDMCKQMFGDKWQIEYEAMMREEFPEESQ